jgi:hypothetical protein
MTAAVLRGCSRFQRLIEHVWRLGPRPVGEVLIAVADGAEPLEVLEQFSQLHPDLVLALGGRHWPPAPMLVVSSMVA